MNAVQNISNAEQSIPQGELSLVTSASSTKVAYEAIKREILMNHLHPGEPVPIGRFVRMLGLSRTPIREALLQLSREGFIESRPRLGTFVSHLDIGQIQDMYEVRGLLEGRAAKLLVQRISEDKLREIETKLRAQRQTGEIDCPALSDAGKDLHNLIVSECGNRVLSQMILLLCDHFERFRNLSLAIPEKILASHQEHIEIVEYLLQRDGQRAEDAIHRHFAHASQSLLESILRREQFSPAISIAVSSRIEK